jgi:hypothetical protein
LGDEAALVTIHPSWLLRMPAWLPRMPAWLLRMPDPAMKARERGRFVDDLKLAIGLVKMAA